jgi:uncharacterized protein (TIGR03435 family)
MTKRISVLLLAAFVSSPALVRAQAAPRFEVASLKERDRNVPLGLIGMQPSPGRLISGCATLTQLVYYAFRRTSSTPIEGLPGWATTPCSQTDTANTYEFQATMPPETKDDDVRLMLQAFLAERFKLAFHWETRTLPIFELVVAPGGFKLKATDPKDDPPRAPGSIGCPADDPRCHNIVTGSVPMALFASAVAFNAGRPVIDKTGLRETYYLDLKWAGDITPNSSLPTLPTALRERFGLELKPSTGPVEVLVIDRAEKPTPN